MCGVWCLFVFYMLLCSSILDTVYTVDPATIRWAERALQKPVLDHWWQTESGWPISANQVGTQGYLPVKYGSSFKAVQGWNLKIFDSDEAVEVSSGNMGRIAVKLPTPPGFMLTLFNNDERFCSSYMQDIPGYYNTGDAGVIDEDNYVHVMTRTDDVINVAGHRLSTGAMEEVSAVLCCAVCLLFSLSYATVAMYC